MIVPNIDDYYLINDILKRNYFSAFKKGDKNIEFLLNNRCNNNCLNCYVCQDKKAYRDQEIFTPTKTDKYTNLLNLIDWYIDNNFLCDIHLNGCIENEEEKQILYIFQQIFNKFTNTDFKPKNIFIYTQGKNIHLLKEINKIFYKNDINICTIFNINGYYCDNIDINYADIIEYINHNDCKISACIDAKNIVNWIKNYKWWFIQLGFDNLHKLYLTEVLNDSWDLKAINDYLIFLDFQIDFLKEHLKNFQDFIFGEKLNFTTIQLIDQQYLTNQKYYQDCLFHSGLTIDLLTLKIPACSKLNYPIFHAGYFEKKEDNNFDIYPINLKILIPKAHLKKSCTPHCEFCDYLNLCEKTCYGENFKVSYNPICPIKESCDLTKAKINFLIYKYKLLHLFNLDQYDLNLAFKQDLMQIEKNIIIQEEKI